MEYYYNGRYAEDEVLPAAEFLDMMITVRWSVAAWRERCGVERVLRGSCQACMSVESDPERASGGDIGGSSAGGVRLRWEGRGGLCLRCAMHHAMPYFRLALAVPSAVARSRARAVGVRRSRADVPRAARGAWQRVVWGGAGAGAGGTDGTPWSGVAHARQLQDVYPGRLRVAPRR